MIKKIFLSAQKNLSHAAVIVTGVIIIAKILGLLKFRIIAYYFGVSPELDIFYAANTIPDIIFYAFTGGAFSSAIIPLLANKNSVSDEKFNKAFSELITFWGIFLLFTSGILFISSPIVTQLFLRYSKEYYVHSPELMTQISRMLSVVPFFLGISTLITAGLQVKRRFLISSLSMPMHTLGSIIGIFIFSKIAPSSVYGLVWGTILGSILHLTVQIPGLKGINYKFFFHNKIWNKNIKFIFEQSIPRILGMLSSYVPRIQATRIALRNGMGAWSAFQYANQIYLIPATMLGYSISQTVFPKLSAESPKKDKTNMVKTLSRAVNFILLTTVPMASVILVTRFLIVRIFLSTGKFDMNSIYMTSWVLAMFAVGVIGQSVIMVIYRAYYSLNDTLTPFYVSLLSATANMILNVLLTNLFSNYWNKNEFLSVFWINSPDKVITSAKTLFQWLLNSGNSPVFVAGLSLAISISLIFEIVSLSWGLHKRIGYIDKSDFIEICKKLIAGVVSFFSIYPIIPFSLKMFDITRTLDTLFILLIQAGWGFLIFFLTLYVFKDKMLIEITDKVVTVIKDSYKIIKNIVKLTNET